MDCGVQGCRVLQALRVAGLHPLPIFGVLCLGLAALQRVRRAYLPWQASPGHSLRFRLARAVREPSFCRPASLSVEHPCRQPCSQGWPHWGGAGGGGPEGVVHPCTLEGGPRQRGCAAGRDRVEHAEARLLRPSKAFEYKGCSNPQSSGCCAPVLTPPLPPPSPHLPPSPPAGSGWSGCPGAVLARQARRPTEALPGTPPGTGCAGRPGCCRHGRQGRWRGC